MYSHVNNDFLKSCLTNKENFLGLNIAKFRTSPSKVGLSDFIFSKSNHTLPPLAPSPHPHRKFIS